MGRAGRGAQLRSGPRIGGGEVGVGPFAGPGAPEGAHAAWHRDQARDQVAAPSGMGGGWPDAVGGRWG